MILNLLVEQRAKCYFEKVFKTDRWELKILPLFLGKSLLITTSEVRVFFAVQMGH